jgi:hypothetical protein
MSDQSLRTTVVPRPNRVSDPTYNLGTVIGSVGVTTLETSVGVTYTPEQLLCGNLRRKVTTQDSTDTLPLASLILSYFKNQTQLAALNVSNYVQLCIENYGTDYQITITHNASQTSDTMNTPLSFRIAPGATITLMLRFIETTNYVYVTCIGSSATTSSSLDLIDGSTFFVNETDPTKSFRLVGDALNAGQTATYFMPEVPSSFNFSVLLSADNETNVEGKTFLMDPNENHFVDSTDITKALRFNLSGATTATESILAFPFGATRNITFPDASTTLVGNDNTQTLQFKSFRDDNCQFIDNSDATKIARFQCSSISTATTRTFTLPDASTTLVGNDNVVTVTNKRISNSSIKLEGVIISGDVTIAQSFTSGRVYSFNTATGAQATLPALDTCPFYRFVIRTVASSGNHSIRTDSSANIMNGYVINHNSGTASITTFTAKNTITFNSNQIGDWIEIYTEGTNWMVTGWGNGAAAVTLTP